MPRSLLFVVNHAGFFLSHRLPVALAAQRAGYDVHVATPKSRHTPMITDAGLPWHGLRLSRSGRNPAGEAATLADLYRLYRTLRPSIVHHVTSKPVVYGTIAARMTSVPAVVNAISGVGHVFADRGTMAALLRIPLSAGYGAALRHPNMRVIFQNDEQREQFVRRGWAQERDTVLIAGSGVDTAVFTPGPGGVSPPLVVLPSRMLKTKGVEEFVAAARVLKAEGSQARFALVGEPDPDNLASISESRLQAWAAEGIVEYWGRRNDMPAVLQGASIACLPSYSEGLPKSLAEAAACGLPMVATDIAGCRMVVQHERTGLLVPVADSRALASAVRRLLSDDQLRARYGAAAREHAVASLGLDNVVSAHLQTYQQLHA